jgi:outer membrane protein
LVSRLPAWLALALALVAAPSVAQTRIGYVNLDRIMREAPVAQRALKKLESEFQGRNNELGKLAEQLKRMQENLDKNSVTMSETDRNRREREFNDANREFQRKEREFREDYGARRNEELNSILSRANDALRRLAETDKLDVVFQNDQVVWANPKIDITEKIIKALEDQRAPEARPADGKGAASKAGK